jgi:GTP-binding protein EngB required for normal cell division
MKEQQLLQWYENHAKPFFETHSKERIAGFENDYERLKKLLAMPDSITVCFLGNSGIGKSTLLNALAAGKEQVLPAGGIGPLTAQATEVFYSEVPTFKVTYQPRGHLWKVAFALEQRLTHQEKAKTKQSTSPKVELPNEEVSDFHHEISEDDKQEILESASSIPESSSNESATHDQIEGFIKQARQIVTGNQFSEKPLPYLVDALRVACDIKPRWHSTLDADDQTRINKIKEIIKPSRANRNYERRQEENKKEFMEDLRAHAAGFLSPLIETIHVGWPSDVLKAGVTLVDLPGVGIANDAYRSVTGKYVREKARAVIVVVDRAGPTESTVELLRTSGYWDRLVGATDDPESDPCSMLITVTKVDDVAAEEWRNTAEDSDGKRPKKREVFANLVVEFRPRMLSQIKEQLSKIGTSDNETVRRAREQARENILDSLQIHPVSAPEYRKILIDDEEDRAFLPDLEQTGIPTLQASLKALSEGERQNLRRRIDEVSKRFSDNLINELSIIEAQWKERTRAAEEAEKLADALEQFMGPKQKEYDLRVGGFREFLEETVQASIRELVLEARGVAETEVNSYLYDLQWAHWATLRAAVRRGGTFYGSRTISLPDDIANYFQEPMAAVWGQKLLKGIRKRTKDLSSDIAEMVQEICEWAIENGGAQINKSLLENQQTRISNQADQMNQVGKEAVDELRALVKQKLREAIRKPIENACQKFVADGNDIGPGVKTRILHLFNALARQATDAAKEPAIEILQSNYKVVREEIQTTFSQWGEPLLDTANLIVERHEERMKRSDAQKRSKVLADIEAVLTECPIRETATEAA